MTEIYIFSRHDELLASLSEDTGLIQARFREELNQLPDQPFSFTVDAGAEEAEHVIEENQVVFRDKEGELRLYVIKEVEDIGGDVSETTALCEPAFMELKEHIIVERRFIDQTAQKALDAALEGTRWTGTVEIELGQATTNFYYTTSVDAIWKIMEVWGGEFKDVVEFSGNRITARKIRILARRGVDNGKRFEVGHNTEEIQRTVLSYPFTALYGRGASLEIEDEDGNHTGGYSRYIDFADVVWSKSKGDPVDKPKGQKWVGDPDALKKYGREHAGKLLHREGIYENGDYEDPAELLKATWEQLQKVKKPEVNYRLAVHLLESLAGYEHERVSLGDTARAIDRNFSRPIEIQARVIAIEYDLLDIEGTATVEMGQFLSVYEYDDRLDKVVREVNDNKRKWDTGGGPISPDKYPDIIPSVPANIELISGFAGIQIYWSFNINEIYVAAYELYASEVKGFTPTPETMVYRGAMNGFFYEGETDKTYYFRVRAVNYHGRYSNYSAEVSASTTRIISDDILFNEDMAAKLRELSEKAQIIADGTIDLDQLEESAREQLKEDAKRYTDQEIQHVTNAINQELADKAGLEYVDGRFQFTDEKLAELDSIADNLTREVGDISGTVSGITTNIDEINGELSATATRLTNIDDTLSAQEADIRANAEAITARVTIDEFNTTTGELTSKVGGLELTANALRADFGELSKTVDGVTEKQASLETSINGLKADVSSVETRVDKNTGDITNVSSRTSQLELRADQFSITIAELSHAATTGDNIIPDGSFEGGGLGWHGVGEIVDDAYSGKKALEFKAGPGTKAHNVTNPVAVVPGRTYRISYWYKTSADANGTSSNQKFRFGNADTGALVKDWGWSGAKTEWTQIKGTWKCPENVKALSVSMVTNHTVGWVRVDDFEVVDITDVSSLQTSIEQNTRQISLVASDTSVLDGRMTQAEAELRVQADEIALRVEKDGIINAINVSDEGIRIDGAKTRITGQTLIDNGVIKSAHIGEAAVGTAAIANASINRAKLQNAIIGTAQIENGAITNAKIGNLSADKINTGTLRAITISGVTINGSSFRSDNGSSTFTVSGASMWLRNSNNFSVEVNSTGLYGRNADNTIRFMANSELVTTMAFGTSTRNVYLAAKWHPNIPEENGEARVIAYQSLGGDGRWDIYDYLPLRADGFYGNFLNTSKGYHLYLRTGEDNAEVRLTASSQVQYYRNLRANQVYANALQINDLTEAANLYLRPRTDGEVRVTRIGTTDDYRDLRCRFVKADAVDTTATHLYLRVAGSGGAAHVTARGSTSNYRDINAANFTRQSTRAAKTNFGTFEDDYSQTAVDIINDLTVITYDLKGDIAEGITDNRQIGFISEDSPMIASRDGKGIVSDFLTAFHTKAIQEIDVRLEDAEDRVSILELENQLLKKQIKELEERIT
ncbi:phage tail spike protein [Shouchella clausii]|uniref:phage tail spike protein n=1 Tax=Shouchella clausii TaxID=79880 RepID=UPI0015CC48F9|nr:phage tail spike protein [Shouchella clausii]